MRRLVPWALLALVGIGAGLGSALGTGECARHDGFVQQLVGAAAQRWLPGILAATGAAGTAHVDYTGIAPARIPCRGSSSGSGVVIHGRHLPVERNGPLDGVVIAKRGAGAYPAPDNR